MIVRFEVDACLPTDSASKVTDQETKSLDDLSSQLSNFSLTSSSSQEKASSGPSIDIIMGGREVPQGTLVEMTCRAEGKLKWADSYPQLFLTQIPHFFLATHNNGVVTHISDNKLSSENMIEKNKTLQPAFRKLKLVLEMIQESAVLHGNGARLSLMCQKGELKIYKRKSQESCLPEDILRRFDVT